MSCTEWLCLACRDAVLGLMFRLVQWSWWPARRAGSFGTADDALEFSRGSAVPWWLECRWPLRVDMTFICDCESYYESGYQIVRPMWRSEAALMEVQNCDGLSIFICGAPTLIISEPRPRRKQPAQYTTPDRQSLADLVNA